MKKFSFLFPALVLVTMMFPLRSSAQYMRGDVDGSGHVSIEDVTGLIDYLLSGNWSSDASEPANGQTITYDINGVPLKMVYVRGGTFLMGGTADQLNDVPSNELPTHYVTLSGYYIAETEVTQALWTAIMSSNPSYHTGNYQYPVEQVSWNACQTFINRLNTLTGLHFRLPTEAEWEYAARGGSLSQHYKYAGSDTIDYVAWYSGNSGSQTHVVATKAPNELGLYDMSGNVYEWCQDLYAGYDYMPQTNPTGPETGDLRVFRGGGWLYGATNCRVSYRDYSLPMYTYKFVGLRLAL